MKEWALDLHLHSVLSPCAGDDMLPPLVIEKALALGYDAIAITDHNTAENVSAFETKGREKGLRVIPGMEVQTSEDIHLLCLFDTVRQVLTWQEIVYQHLPALKNKKESLGEQWLVDKDGNKIGEVDRLLLVGTSLSMEEVVSKVHQLKGICIASHLDRQAFSLWGHLGYLPGGLLDGGELTSHLPPNPLLMGQLKKQKLAYIISSDAHYLDSMIKPQYYAVIKEGTVEEIQKALKNEDGRLIKTAI